MCASWASRPARRSARCWRAANALDALVASVSATMEALAGDEPPESVAPDFQTSRAASYVSHHWEL